MYILNNITKTINEILVFLLLTLGAILIINIKITFKVYKQIDYWLIKILETHVFALILILPLIIIKYTLSFNSMVSSFIIKIIFKTINLIILNKFDYPPFIRDLYD